MGNNTSQNDNIINKNAVLDRIKKFYLLKGNADLARFLGVSPNTITNWYNRNTLDIDTIYTKCVNVDLNWLLSGQGNPNKNGDIELLKNDNLTSGNSETMGGEIGEKLGDIEKNIDTSDTLARVENWAKKKSAIFRKLLKKNNLHKMDDELLDIDGDIDSLGDYIFHYSLSNKLNEPVDQYLDGNLTMDELVNKLNDTAPEFIELYNIVIKYQSYIRTLYNEVVAFNKKYDRENCYGELHFD